MRSLKNPPPSGVGSINTEASTRAVAEYTKAHLPAGTRPVEIKPEPEQPALDVVVGCERTDLPPRNPEEISALLKLETPEQTRARIANDLARYHRSRSGRVGTNPQATVISPDRPTPSNNTWGRR